MATLYELTGQFRTIYDMDELDENVWLDTLESLEGEIEEKADGYAKVITNLTADIEPLDKEIKRLQAKKQVIQNKITGLKESLQESMQATGKTKFKTDLYSFNVQKNPASVEVLDENKIYIDYFKVEQVRKLDKKLLLADLKAGKEVPGVEIKQTESLRIR